MALFESDHVTQGWLLTLVLTTLVIIALAVCYLVFVALERSYDFHPFSRKRAKLAFWYTKSNASIFVELTNILLNLFSCSMFVWLTTEVAKINVDDPNKIEKYRAIFDDNWLIWNEFVISLIFMTDFTWNFVISDEKLKYLFNIHAIVDLITCIPGLASPGLGFFFYGFQMFRFIRAYRSVHYFRLSGFAKLDGIEAQFFLLIFTVISFLFCAAGLIYVVENPIITSDGGITNFFDGIYFVLVSISTVGYGDLAAVTTAGRVVVLLLLLTALGVVPFQVGKLIQLLQESLEHNRFFGRGHVILSAHRESAIAPWLKEFYHKDRIETYTHVCLLIPDQQLSRRVNMYLNRPSIAYRVTKIIGSALLDGDLKRANLRDAAAVFIISDHGVDDPDAEDARTIMEVIALRRHNPTVPIYAQVLTTKHRDALKVAGVEAILCVNELKMRFLTSSCLCPGLSTLITNLIVTYSLKETNPHSWRGQFAYGLGHELYQVSDLSNFVGLSYGELTMMIFNELDILVLALLSDQSSSSDGITSQGSTLIVNPSNDRIISANDQIVVCAQDGKDANNISNINVDEFMSKYRSKILPIVNDGKDDPTCDKCNLFHSLTGAPSQQTLQYKKVPIEDVIIDHFTDANLSDHIIVTGSWPEISDFLVSLRQHNLKQQIPIVVLNSVLPDDSTWNKINYLPKLYIVQGLSSDTSALERAGWQVASRIMILGDQGNQNDPAIDAKSVMLYNMTKKSKNLYPIVDLVHKSNIRFLDHVRQKKSSFLKYADNAEDKDLESAPYAIGHAFVSSCLENLLSQVYTNKWIVQVLEQLLEGNLFSLSIQKHFPSFSGKHYNELFAHVLGSDYLALGLFRTNEIDSYPSNFVVTNPPGSTILKDTDEIYLLQSCAQPPKKFKKRRVKSSSDTFPDLGNGSASNIIKNEIEMKNL